jgi:fibronectin type III domain protein
MSKFDDLWAWVNTNMPAGGTVTASPAPASQGVSLQTPKLKKLTPDQAAKCHQYLTAHKFAALLIPGKKGINAADYEPGLDYKATTIEAIVKLLEPFTLLNPEDELRDLVQLRYGTMVGVAITVAKEDLKQQGNVLGPTNLEAKPGDTKMWLSWSAAPDAKGYNVYRNTTGGNKGGTPLKSVTTTYFVDSGLVNDKKYFYRVTATTPSGESMSSEEVSATPKEGQEIEVSASTEVTSNKGKTEINYKLEIKGQDEEKKIQLLPQLDLKVNVGDDGKPVLVGEAQIELIKQHVKKNLKLVGKVELEVKVTANAQANLTGPKAGELEANIKGELEVKLGRVTINTSVEASPTKKEIKPSAGFNVVLWRF